MTCLEIGALPNDYADDISFEGIESLLMLKRPYGLKKVRIEYCTKIGDKAIQALAKRFDYCLEEFSIIRNYYEKAARISDEAFKYLQDCYNLRKLEIVYSRKFDEKLAFNLSETPFDKLIHLNLSSCPIQVSLEPLVYGCPNLEELDLSGDSWVKRQGILGIAKHPKLIVLHLGHFEHSDFNCSETISEHPPKAFFIAGLFDKPENFPCLKTLFLEANCSFTPLLEGLIQKARPNLLIRVHHEKSLVGEALVRNEEAENEVSMDNGQRYGIYENDDDDIDFRFM